MVARTSASSQGGLNLDFCGFQWLTYLHFPSDPPNPSFWKWVLRVRISVKHLGDFNVTKLENLWAESLMILWVNSLTSSDSWVEQFGESYDQNKPVSLVSYANGHRGLIITWQHKCPIISVCCSVPGDQLFCNNGHAQHWTAHIQLSCSPPHSFLMGEEPPSSQGFNPLLPGPKDQGSWGGDLVLSIRRKWKKDSQEWLFGAASTLHLRLCFSLRSDEV